MQPLAKLLQSSAEITSIADNARSGSKRKLRQEVLDVQRLKDVGKAQPVSIQLTLFDMSAVHLLTLHSHLSTRSTSTLISRSCSPLDLHQLSSCTMFPHQHPPLTPS